MVEDAVSTKEFAPHEVELMVLGAVEHETVVVAAWFTNDPAAHEVEERVASGPQLTVVDDAEVTAERAAHEVDATDCMKVAQPGVDPMLVTAWPAEHADGNEVSCPQATSPVTYGAPLMAILGER